MGMKIFGPETGSVRSARGPASPIPLEVVLRRMTPRELCEAMALLRRCERVGSVDRALVDQLAARIAELPALRRDRHEVHARSQV